MPLYLSSTSQPPFFSHMSAPTVAGGKLEGVMVAWISVECSLIVVVSLDLVDEPCGLLTAACDSPSSVFLGLSCGGRGPEVAKLVPCLVPVGDCLWERLAAVCQIYTMAAENRSDCRVEDFIQYGGRITGKSDSAGGAQGSCSPPHF